MNKGFVFRFKDSLLGKYVNFRRLVNVEFYV